MNTCQYLKNKHFHFLTFENTRIMFKLNEFFQGFKNYNNLYTSVFSTDTPPTNTNMRTHPPTYLPGSRHRHTEHSSTPLYLHSSLSSQIPLTHLKIIPYKNVVADQIILTDIQVTKHNYDKTSPSYLIMHCCQSVLYLNRK